MKRTLAILVLAALTTGVAVPGDKGAKGRQVG